MPPGPHQERHPMASQAFVPLAPRPFLVGAARDRPQAEQLTAFRTTAGQGVNYARGVWHHPLIAINQATDFLVIDREGAGENCDEATYDSEEIWVE
jgi:ureidoglycolate lyase